MDQLLQTSGSERSPRNAEIERFEQGGFSPRIVTDNHVQFRIKCNLLQGEGTKLPNEKMFQVEVNAQLFTIFIGIITYIGLGTASPPTG